jgi:prepilin-type processing-associated H-X9-DG protein
MFGSNVSVSMRDLRDGASQTFAIGERCWTSYASIWAGADGWNRCEREGVAMIMATAHYPLNTSPNPYYLSCDPGGAAGFTSSHASGANFLLADGSVRFVSDHIQFANSSEPSKLGIYQKLSRRDDGQSVGDY